MHLLSFGRPRSHSQSFEGHLEAGKDIGFRKGKSPLQISNALEVIEGLLTYVALVMRLARGAAKFADHSGVLGSAFRTFNHLRLPEEYRLVVGVLHRRCDAIFSKLFFGIICQPGGGPRRAQGAYHFYFVAKMTTKGGFDVCGDHVHRRTSAVSWGDGYDGLVVDGFYFAHNSHVHNIQHRNFRVFYFLKKLEYVDLGERHITTVRLGRCEGCAAFQRV